MLIDSVFETIREIWPMKNSPYALSKKIYRCRELLIRLAGEHGTAHPSVLLQSRKLDKLM